MPILGTVIDADGDVKHLESGDDAFFGFKTALRDSDVVRLIETIREDDAEKFSTFNYMLIENITMNVELADLPGTLAVQDLEYEIKRMKVPKLTQILLSTGIILCECQSISNLMQT
ncbi:hypothetical protein ACTXT7_015519 [Hymenolepis weldensis]